MVVTPEPPLDPPANPVDLGGPVDLGVLLVHGIGEQAQGETLTKFAEPIVDWIRDWLQRESAVGTRFASTPIEAALHPPLLAADVPARARVLIGTGRDGHQETQEWLFAEAWWSPQVLRPPIAAFTGWLLTRGPWLLLFHMNQELLTSPRPALQVAFGIPLSIAWVLLSLMINLVLIAASLFALIPIGSLRNAVYAVLRTLTGVVGDAYVLLRSPVQRAAFEEATVDALRWLAPRCRRLAVVAHSQGAAIAHGALQRPQAPSADLLITVGAGITKLEALRYLERLGAADRMAGLLAAPFLVAAGWVWLRTRALGIDDAGTAVLAPGALAVVGTAMLAIVWLTVRRAFGHLRKQSARLSLVESHPALRWVDIVATHDPVPAGELTRFFFDVPQLEARRIPVLRSRLSDHTSYWSARASFIPVLVEQLAQCAGGMLQRMASLDASRSFAAAQRRLDADLRLLGTIRRLDIAAVLLPILVARDRLIANVDGLRALLSRRGASGADKPPLAFVEDGIRRIEQALSWTADVVAGGPVGWVRPVVDVGVAFVLLLLALLLWQRLTFAMWRAWSANRNEEVLRHPDVQRPRKLLWRDRVGRLAGVAVVNGGFVALLLMPFLTSVAWSLLPGWLDEARVYWLLGQTVVVTFVAIMLFSLLGTVAETGEGLLDRWRQWRQQRGAWSWPGFRSAASWAIYVLIAAFAAWFTIDQVMTLPATLRPNVIVLGLLGIARGLVALLDRVWQRLETTGASAQRKLMMLTWPLALGIGVAAIRAAHARDSDLAALASAALLIAAAGAGLTLALLRVRRNTAP
jgi:hypothetical protein